MNRVLFVISIMFALSLCTSGQIAKIPSFGQYPVKVDRTKAKAPNLRSHKDARMFRTSLRIAAKGGINFAGHFVLTYWGCGASCGVGAIIDGRTGRVFFPDQLQGIWAHWDESPIPFGVRRDSRLLMFTGFEPGDYAGNRVRYGIHVYRWNGSTLRKIKYIPKPFD